jgi:hypothetical protein
MHHTCFVCFYLLTLIQSSDYSIEKQRIYTNPIDARAKNVTLIIGISENCYILANKFLAAEIILLFKYLALQISKLFLDF